MGERRHLDRTALGLDLAQRALDLGIEQDALRCALAGDRLLAVRVGASAGVRQEVEACVLDHDRAVEQVGKSAANLIDALAVEDELGEAAVDIDRPLQPPVLGVDDPLEQRRHQVHELNVGRDREQRHLQAVGFGDHLRRKLPQVGQRTHDEAGAARVRDALDEADLRGDVVLDRKACGEHQVAGARLDLGRLHEADPLDLAVEAVRAGDELGRLRHRPRPLTHGRSRFLDFLLFDLFCGHDLYEA